MEVSEGRRLERPWPAGEVERAHRATATEPSADGSSQLADSDLLVLISRRDLRALEVIYDRHIKLAWTVALTFSDDVQVAEQAVEAAFLRLWRQPEPGAHANLGARLMCNVKREARARSRDPGGQGIVETDGAFPHQR